MSPSTFKRLLSAILIAVIISGCSSETNKHSLLERARRDFEAGQYDNARIEYLNVLQLDPRNRIAIQQLGMIWFEDGAPIKALLFLLKAKELAPKELGARVKLAMAMLTLGDASNGRKEALAILDEDPTNDDGVILLAETARTPKDVDETAQRLQKF